MEEGQTDRPVELTPSTSKAKSSKPTTATSTATATATMPLATTNGGSKSTGKRKATITAVRHQKKKEKEKEAEGEGEEAAVYLLNSLDCPQALMELFKHDPKLGSVIRQVGPPTNMLGSLGGDPSKLCVNLSSTSSCP